MTIQTLDYSANGGPLKVANRRAWVNILASTGRFGRQGSQVRLKTSNGDWIPLSATSLVAAISTREFVELIGCDIDDSNVRKNLWQAVLEFAFFLPPCYSQQVRQ